MFTTVEGDDDDNNHGCAVFQQWYISNDEQPCYHLYILQYMELLWGKTWTCVHEPTPRFANIDDTRFINSYIYMMDNVCTMGSMLTYIGHMCHIGSVD